MIQTFDTHGMITSTQCYLVVAMGTNEAKNVRATPLPYSYFPEATAAFCQQTLLSSPSKVVAVSARVTSREMKPIAAVGLHNNSATQVAIRPAPDDIFGPALRQFGLQDCSNATKDSMSGLVPNYIAGDPLPGGKELKRNFELEHVPPNSELAFYTLVGLPNKALSMSSAAVLLVEQHDAKGNVVGGVAVIFLGDYPSPPSLTPSKQPRRQRSLRVYRFVPIARMLARDS